MMTQKDILQLLKMLNEEMKSLSTKGELYLVGGAVMCLVFNARPSTKDIDAYFEPANKLKEAARRVALKSGVSEDWLNDAVKGYLSLKGLFEPYLELSHLAVFTARADYLLSMKCLAMRIGEEFHDLEDIQYLLRNLNIESYPKALEVIQGFYPLEKFPQKTLYALEEILEKN